MEINQTHSTNYETQNMQQMTQSQETGSADQAKRTGTEPPQLEGANIRTNGEDRVEISREAQELAHQNSLATKGQVETSGGSDPAQIAKEADISNVI